MQLLVCGGSLLLTRRPSYRQKLTFALNLTVSTKKFHNTLGLDCCLIVKLWRPSRVVEHALAVRADVL